MHRGIATFMLDIGTCPKWLFERMVKLGREMAQAGEKDKVLKQLAEISPIC